MVLFYSRPILCERLAVTVPICVYWSQKHDLRSNHCTCADAVVEVLSCFAPYLTAGLGYWWHFMHSKLLNTASTLTHRSNLLKYFPITTACSSGVTINWLFCVTNSLSVGLQRRIEVVWSCKMSGCLHWLSGTKWMVLRVSASCVPPVCSLLLALDTCVAVWYDYCMNDSCTRLLPLLVPLIVIPDTIRQTAVKINSNSSKLCQ